MHPESAEANGKSRRDKNVFRPSTVCVIGVNVSGFTNGNDGEGDDSIRDM